MALAITAVLSVIASIEYFGFIERLTRQTGDAMRIGEQEVRFASTRGQLAGVTYVGYFNDREKGSVRDQAAGASAQFAMAPKVLVHDERRGDIEFWVGDFSAPREFARIGDVKGLRVVADLGNGVVLYRRRAAK